jgi:hypothetical protein
MVCWLVSDELGKDLEGNDGSVIGFFFIHLSGVNEDSRGQSLSVQAGSRIISKMQI